MIRKSCIHYEWFGDYSMDLCTNGRKNKMIDGKECDCRGCRNYRTASSDLEKCPFCGGKAKIYCSDNYLGTWEVSCRKCGARMDSDDINIATKKWNRRM